MGKFDFPFTEFGGTFLIVLTACYSLASDAENDAMRRTKCCMALSTILVPVSYIFHRQAQVHLNPAITIAAALSNLIRPHDAALYVGAQFLGAIAAGICASYAKLTIPALAISGQDTGAAIPALFVELLYTSMMVYVAFSVGQDMPNAWFGVCIGSVQLSAKCIAATAGAYLNPAIAFGLEFAMHHIAQDGSSSNWESYEASVKYMGAEVVGAIVAALCICVTRPGGGHSQGGYNAALRMLSELVGTFFVVVTGCISAISSESSTALGAAVLAFSYAAGPISGGYLNPAVTVSVVLDHHGAHDFEDLGLYLLAQLGGSLAGATVVQWWMTQANAQTCNCGWFSCDCSGGSGLSPKPLPGDSTKVALGEFPFTLILCLVSLYTHHSNKPPWYGCVAALCVVGGGLAAYDLSGGLLNPALALARGILNDDPEGATSHIFCEVIAGLTATGIFWGLKLQDVGGGGGYEAAPQNEC